MGLLSWDAAMETKYMNKYNFKKTLKKKSFIPKIADGYPIKLQKAGWYALYATSLQYQNNPKKENIIMDATDIW